MKYSASKYSVTLETGLGVVVNFMLIVSLNDCIYCIG